MDGDPRGWRPMAFESHGHRAVRDPIVEPAWDGLRVLAHVRSRGTTRFVDVEGYDVTDAHAEVARALTEATVEPAIVDGYLTDQATRTSVGIELKGSQPPSVKEHTAGFFLGGAAARMAAGEPGPNEIRRRVTEVDEEVAAGPVAFVAVDLVSLDGEPLTSLPLLERKRLLESVVAEGDLVRRTPFVRPPAGSFLQSWRSQGFASIIYKAANSRYLPGHVSEEWSVIPIPRR